MRKSTDQPFSSAFKDWLRDAGMDKKFDATALVNAWPALMGPMIARHTREISLRDGVLFVSLDSAPLRQELVQSRERILHMLNEHAGSELVKEVVFR
ncbi:MAG: DUF721 domain-containing protein [Bacteroidota bacterium]